MGKTRNHSRTRQDQLGSLTTGLKRARTHISQLIDTVQELTALQEDERQTHAETPELSVEAQQLVQLCLDNDLHERLGTLILSWDKAKVAALVDSWLPSTFGIVCRVWSAQFTADLLQNKSANWIASACESMNIDEISQLLPLLKKRKIKLIMGKLYFRTDDALLSRDECKEVVSKLSQVQRTALIAKYGQDASGLLDSDSSDVGQESGGENNVENDESYDSSFIEDDQEDEDDDSDYVGD